MSYHDQDRRWQKQCFLFLSPSKHKLWITLSGFNSNEQIVSRLDVEEHSFRWNLFELQHFVVECSLICIVKNCSALFLYVHASGILVISFWGCSLLHPLCQLGISSPFSFVFPFPHLLILGFPFFLPFHWTLRFLTIDTWKFHCWKRALENWQSIGSSFLGMSHSFPSYTSQTRGSTQHLIQSCRSRLEILEQLYELHHIVEKHFHDTCKGKHLLEFCHGEEHVLASISQRQIFQSSC